MNNKVNINQFPGIFGLDQKNLAYSAAVLAGFAWTSR